MKCIRCGRNTATLHVTNLKGGRAREEHYCKTCIPKAWIGPEAKRLTGKSASITCPGCGRSMSLEIPFPLKPPGPEDHVQKLPRVQCPNCSEEFTPMLLNWPPRGSRP